MKIDPRLEALFHPPCIKAGKYRYCPVEHENTRRVQGLDPMGCCPLWAMHEGKEWMDHSIPLRRNAEVQYKLQRTLWPNDVREAVDRYIDQPTALP